MEQGQSNWVGYHISVNSASARKTKEGRSSKCLGLEGGSSTKFCTRQLPWQLLSYFGLYCFVSFSFFGDNCTLDNLTSYCYLFCKLNWPIVQVAYLTTVSSLHNTIWNNTTSISNKYIFVSFPYQLIIIAWSMPYCHCLVTGSLNLYYWCKAQNSGWHLREADTYRISQDAQMR